MRIIGKNEVDMDYFATASVTRYNETELYYKELCQFNVHRPTIKSAIEILKKFVAAMPIELDKLCEIRLEITRLEPWDSNIVWSRWIEVSKNGKLIRHKI